MPDEPHDPTMISLRSSDDPVNDPTSSMSEGALLGERYRLASAIKAGGMGEVWRAMDERMGGLVAVKILRLGLSHLPEVRQRFEREIAILRDLKSPHVVRVTDFGRFEGRLYMVMELLEGQDLESHLKKHAPLPWSEALPILRAVAEVLAEAHERGLIHRDLKPANVFLQKVPGREQAVVRVLDFGIAKAHQDDVNDAQLTDAGLLIGTPDYMAPEQINGHAEPATDLYALGVVAYNALTGQRLFDVRSVAGIIHHHINSTPPSPDSKIPSLPKPVVELVNKLLKKNPRERPESATEVCSAIDSALNTPPAFQRQRSTPNWVSYAIIQTMTAALVAGAMAGLVWFFQPPNKPNLLSKERLRSLGPRWRAMYQSAAPENAFSVVASAPQEARLGEVIELSVQSSAPGTLWVFQIDNTDHIDCIVPNNQWVRADLKSDELVHIPPPKARWKLRASEPTGEHLLVFLVTPEGDLPAPIFGEAPCVSSVNDKPQSPWGFAKHILSVKPLDTRLDE